MKRTILRWLAAATALTAPLLHAAPPGTALDFDGVNDYVSVGNGASLQITGTAITVEAWIRADTWRTNVWEGSVVVKDGPDSGYMLRCGAGGVANFSFGAGSAWHEVSSAAVMSTGTWYHLAGVYNGATVALYVNGELRANAAATASIANNANPLQIGASPAYVGTRLFDGRIDEVRVWDVAHTAQQIRESMHLALTGFEPGLKGYWRLDEGAGTIAADLSANGNHGTLTNMDLLTAWVDSTAPVALGFSSTQTVGATGPVVFLGTNLGLNVTAKSGTTTFVVSRLLTAPNVRPAGTAMGNETWIVNAFDGGVFTADVTLVGQTGVTTADQATPARIRLHRRDSTSDGEWGPLAFAHAADATAGTVVFKGIRDTSQWVLTHDEVQAGPGTALDFDGSNDYVNCGLGPVITGSLPRTIEAWAYARSFNDGGIFQAGITGAGNDDRDFSLRTLTTDDQWRLQLWGENDIDVTLPDSKNQWHHYALTYDGVTVMFYYDGELKSELTVTLNTGNTDGFRIGRWENSSFNGRIDEVRVWNVARTAEQIRESMHLALTGSEPELKGYWRLDEGAGTSTVDASGNANTGTLTNMDPATDWVASTVPLASGASASRTVSATGPVTFTGTDLDLDFSAKTGTTTFVVSHLLGTPNVAPAGPPLGDVYWVVRAYDGGAWTTTAIFAGQDGLCREDAVDPSRVKLHSRASNSDGAWSQQATAEAAHPSAGTATFVGLTEFSQLALTRDPPTRLALDFDGVNDYVNVPHSASLNVSTELTVEVWVNLPNPVRNQKIVGKTAIGPGFLLGVSQTGGIYPEVWNSSGTRYWFYTSGNILPNTWTHLAMTWQTGGRLAAYINGVRAYDTPAGSNPIGANTQPLRIGIAPWNATSYPLEGKLDELRIWNVARTEEQIRDDMHRELAGGETGLVACYRFDHTAGTTLSDLTANANHGALVNMTDEDWVAAMFPCALDLADLANLRAAWTARTASLPSSILSLTAPAVVGEDVVVAGHNNAALTRNTSDKPIGLDWRLERVWRLEADTPVSGDFVFDTTALPGVGNREGMRLLVDADGAFADATVVAGTADSGVLTIPGQTFTDGAYITLAGIDIPEVDTAAVRTLTMTSARGGGTVLDPGGSAVTARGCVWNTAGNPTVDNHLGMTYAGAGAGEFVSDLTGLTVNITYFVRAYATNAAGTAYGLQREFRITFFAAADAGLVDVDWSGIAWGDVEGDGDLDLVLAGADDTDTPTTVLYRNDGGVLTLLTGSGLPDRACDLAGAAWGDYDNDGDLDLCLAGYETSWDHPSQAAIYRNEGNGVFTDIGAPLVSVSYCNAKWADYDNDGDVDLVISGGDWYNAMTRLYRNDGNDTFVDAEANLPDVSDAALAWGDYDNDGDLDLFVAGWDIVADAALTRLCRNDGNGVFTPLDVGTVEVGLADAAWGDYDHDGNLDLLLAGWDSVAEADVTRVYRNHGDGTFTDIGAPLTGVSSPGVAWGDLDNDGDLDLVIAGWRDGAPSFATVYRNDAGVFSELTEAGLTGVDWASLALADADNDGDLDILITGEVEEDVPLTRLYRNEGAPTANTPPTAPAGLVLQAVTGDSATLIWDAATDTETPGASLTYNLRVGTSPGAADVLGPMADLGTGQRYVPALGNTNHRREWTINGLTGNTTYYWSVQAVDAAYAGGPWATEGSFTTPELAQVVTAPVTGVTALGAASGGTVTDEGLSPVTARGCVWAMHHNPSLADFNTVDGAGLGPFVSALEGGLIEGRTCYVRAYATNAEGTAYGENRAFVVPMRPPDRALEFDGNEDFVQVADHDGLDLTGTYTIELWFRADALGGLRGLVSKFQTFEANGYFLRLDGTELDFGQTMTSGLGLQTGRWYHVAAVQTGSGNERLIYVNGQELVRGSNSFVVAANTDPVRIGSDYSGRWFGGTIDEVRLWNVARTETQIRDAMHRALAGTEASLVAYWRGDQTDGGPTLFDRTGHGHDGSLERNPAWVTSTAPCTGVPGDRVQLRGVWSGRPDSTGTPSGRMALADPDIAAADYTVFGHNGVAETQNTADVPAGLHWRLNRVWRLDVAGTPAGDVVLDVSSLANLGDTTKLCLLADANGTFADAVVIDGDLDYPHFTATGVALADGQYLTLGKHGRPSVDTADVSDISSTAAACGGDVFEAGASPVIARGCVWNTAGIPTLDNHLGMTADGVGVAAFQSALTGLTLDQVYFVRAYATNAHGTAYGQERTFRAIAAQPGNCLDFDGTDDYVDCGNSTSLDVGNTLTIEAWVYPTDLSGRHAVFSTRFFGNPAGVFQLEVGSGPAGGTNRVSVSGISTWVVTTIDDVIVPNRWTHIAYTRTGEGTDTHAVYVDGVAQRLESSSEYPFENNSLNKVIGGGTNGAQFFAGRVDDLRLWNVARTPAEIRWGMNRALVGNEDGLVGTWRFDQGTAGGDNAGVTTATDSGTDGLDGTLTNFALTGNTSNWVASYAQARPTAYAAVPDSGGAFLLRWNPPATGPVPTGYVLDVATDAGFASLVTGYDTLSAGAVTSYLVTGLDNNATYYWRVRAEGPDGAGQSQSSEAMVLTAGAENARFAPHLDGIDDYLTLPCSYNLSHNGTNYLHDEFLIEMWFKPETASGTLLDKGDAFALRLEDDAGTARLRFWGIPEHEWRPAAPLSNAPAVSLDTWHHVAVRYDGSDWTLYLDGQSKATGAATGDLTANSNIITIGRDAAGSGFFTGSLAELRIWTKPRTDAKVRRDWDREVWYHNRVDNDGFLHYLPLAEGAGRSAGDYRFADLSAALHGGAQWRKSDLAILPAGPRDWMLELNGTDDYLEISDTEFDFDRWLFNFPPFDWYASYTIELWARRDSSGTEDVLYSEGSVDPPPPDAPYLARGMAVGFSAANQFTFGFYHNDGNHDILETPAAYTDTDWHHWALTYDHEDRARRIYRDGVLVASDQARAHYLGDSILTLGRKAWEESGFFHGAIDEMRIWKEVRSADRIKENRFRRVNAHDGALVRCLRFNEWLGVDGRCHWVDAVSGDQNSVTPYGSQLDNVAEFAPAVAPFAQGPTPPSEQALEFRFGSSGGSYAGRDPYARLTSNIDLVEKSQTIEFWAQRYLLDSTTDGDAYAFCHETGEKARLRIGFRKASAGNAFFVDYLFDDDAPGWDAAAIDLAPAYTDADWHHWAVTFTDGSETGGNAALRIFRDGALVHAETLGFAHYRAFGEMLVGNTFGGGEWRGSASELRLDDVRVWSRARGRSEIAADMNRQLAGDEPGLEACYSFNEGGGFSLLDSSVHRRHGRMVLMSDAHRVDHAFPGGFQYLADAEQCLYNSVPFAVAGSESFDYVGDFTWEAWVRPVEYEGWQNLVAMHDRINGWSAGCYTWMIADGMLKLVKSGQDTIPAAGSATAIELHTWQHVALRVETDTNGANDTCSFFVNGRPVYSDSTLDVGADLPPFPYLVVGSTFQGWFDELRLWSLARTDAEILAGYRRRLTGAEPGLEVYYDFDDVGADVVADRSGHGRCGYTGGTLTWAMDGSASPDVFPALPDERAAAFAGSSGYADVPADSVFSDSPFSVEFWVKQDDLGARQGLLDKGHPDDTDWWFASQDGTPAVPRRDDRALRAVGSSDYLTLPQLPAIFTGPGNTISDFTIEFWIKPTPLNYEETVFEITRDTGGEGNYVRLVAEFYFERLLLSVGDDPDDGSFETRDRVGSYLGSRDYQMTEPANTWYHVACVFDAAAPAGQRLRLFVNGIAMNDPGGNHGPTGAGTRFLNRVSGGSNTSGALDNLRLWNVPRTQAEIVSDMHRTLTGAEPGLLHCYRFDDEVGSATAIDSAGANDATVHNSARFVPSTAPLGICLAETRPEAATVTFPAAGLSVAFAEPGAALLTAVRIAGHPGFFPVNAQPFDQQYWVLHRDGPDEYWSFAVYGSPYTADYTFVLAEDLTADDAVTPANIGLYRRNATGDEPWQLVADAASVDPDTDSVAFHDVSLAAGLGVLAPVAQSSQLLVARKSGQGVVFGSGQGLSQGRRELSTVWGDDAWHHVCGTYDGSEMRLYVDGTLEAATTAAMAATTNGIRIGAFRDGSGFFNGLLDEIRFWSVTLSPEDVAFLYNKELRGDEAGLEAYWKFNEGSGSTTADSTGNGHEAVLYSNVERVPHDNDYIGRPVGDYALAIDDQTCVYIGEGLAPTATMTIEAWVHKTAAADSPAVFGFGNSMLTLYAGRGGSERLAYFDDNNGWIESPAVVPTGEWHHLAWVLRKPAGQNGYLIFYLDGLQVQQAVVTQDLPAVIPEGFIGRSALDTDPFFGAITEVRIWGLARTAIQIQDHLTTRLAGNEEGLLAYWPCTDGRSQLVTDASRNGHDGVFLNAFDLHWIEPEGLVFDKPLPTEQSLQFDGTDTAVSLPFSSRGDAFTVGAWIQWDPTGADDAADDVIVGWGGPGQQFAELRVTTERKLMYCEFDGAWGPVVAAPILPANAWVHVGVAKDGTAVTLFLNGQPVISGTILRSPQLDSLAIGAAAADPDLRPFKGLIDEVAFWDLALPAIPTQEFWGDEDHLVRYYRFDEGGGAYAIDATGSGFYNGTLSTGLDQSHRVDQAGLPMVRLADRQCALFFDGIDDFLELPHQPRPDPMTVAAWVKPVTTSQMRTIVAWADDTNSTGHLAALRLNAGRLEYEEVSASGTVTGATPIPANAWTHVAVTKTGDTVSLYVNGAPDGAGTVGGMPVTDRLVVGMQPAEPTDRHFFHGTMDEFQIWTVALAAETLAATYTHGRRGNETGLDTYFTFDQPTGLTVQDLAGYDGNASMKNVDYPNLDRHEVDDLDLGFPPPGPYVLRFDGVDDSLTVDGLEFTAYTVAFWFKPDAAPPATDVWLFKAPACALVLEPDGSVAHTFTTAAGEVAQTLEAAVTFGAWNRIVAANDGLTARLYCGPAGMVEFATEVAADRAFVGGRLESSAGIVTIGNDPDSDYDAPFAGLIEELAVWAWALPEKDVARLWDGELEGDETGLRALYDFDDGDPDAAADSALPAQEAVLHNMALQSREDREPGFVLAVGMPPDGSGDRAEAAPVALEFDGFDDYAELPRAALVMDGDSFTLELWINPVPWAGRGPVVTNAASDSADSAWGIFLNDDGQTWSFELLDDLALNGGAVNDRAWHHLAVVYDADEGLLTLYQDAVEVAADYPGDITGADNSNGLFLGSDADQATRYTGQVDEIRCWSVARTAAEIEADFNRHVRALAPELAGYWRVNDTDTAQVPDLGAGGNTLVLHNMLDVNLVVGPELLPPWPAELALALDGADDYVVLANPDNRLGLQELTLACWFMKTGPGSTAATGPDGLVAVPLIAKGCQEGAGDNDTLVNYLLGISESGVLAVTFQALDGNGTSVNALGTTPILDNTWYYAAATYGVDGGSGELKLYLNGVLERAVATAGQVAADVSVQAPSLGTALNSVGLPQGFFDGILEDVSIWSRALSPAELTVGMTELRRGGETGLVGIWHADDGWADRLPDAGRYAADGTLHNVETDRCWVDGRHFAPPADGDHGIALTAEGQAVELAPAPAAAFSFDGSFTVEFWLKVEAWDTPWQAIVGKGDSNWQVRRHADSARIAFSTPGIQKDADADGTMDDLPELVSTADIQPGAWTHVAVVYDADLHRKRLYLDGVLDAEALDLAGFVQTNAAALWLGANPEVEGRTLNGAVDELRVWDEARSDVRIHANYQRIVRDTEDGLLAWWRFNEGIGATAFDAGARGPFDAMLLGLDGRARVDGVVLYEWSDQQFAVLLDGEDEDIALDTITADLTGGLTLEVWARPDRLQDDDENDLSMHMVHLADAGNQTAVSLMTVGNDLRVEIAEGGAVTGALVAEDVLTPTVWAHLAVTVDGAGVVRLYVDGREQAASAAGENVTISANTVWAGSTFGSNAGGGGFFTGALDEVRLWDGVRTPSEIQVFHDRQLFDGTEDLLGYWRLNEGFGDTGYDESEHDVTATLRNTEAEDWTDGKYIVPDSTSRADLNLAQVPEAAGLWVGKVRLNKVSEAAKVELTPTATRDEMVMDIILHVDATGQVRLLKDVTFMRTATDEQDEAHMVLVTDDTRLGDFVGLVNRNGVLIGLRKSSVHFDFDGNEWPMEGGLGFAHVAYGFITVPADHPTNPYRHKYHPDSTTGFRIDRSFFLVFDDAPAPDGKPGQGVERLNGVYQETLSGLHKKAIRMEGPFELRRISQVDKLNAE